MTDFLLRHTLSEWACCLRLKMQIMISTAFIKDKRDTLQRVATTLRGEFVGLDEIINQIIDLISPWYTFPEIQERPVVINLWGLTGVGKSALVRRIVELLAFENRHIHFDLGVENTGDWNMRKPFELMFRSEDRFPLIVTFDEFQHARTINQQMEIPPKSANLIWQLLDSGQFQIPKDNYRMQYIRSLAKKLEYLLTMGVQVKNGLVIEQEDLFLERMEVGTSEERRKKKKKFNAEDLMFVPKHYHDDLYYLATERFKSEFEVNDILLSLDGEQTIKLIFDVLAHSNAPRTIDASRALIFVLGNLDEAYRMTADFNPDLDPDEFHRISLKISIPEIKNALKERFRSEQIARLGNNHIIYPAFNSEHFRQIIQLLLGKITNRLKTVYDVTLSFDSSLLKFLFEEGVYPVQGTRPLISTIYDVVETKLGKILLEIPESTAPTVITLGYVPGHIVVTYKSNEGEQSIKLPQLSRLNDLRKCTHDDRQAITAVHESGHALIAILLFHTLPQQVVSITSDADTEGYVYADIDKRYTPKEDIVRQVALCLAGKVAESLVFGEDAVTSGSISDIERATKFVSRMIRKCGMGEISGRFSFEPTDEPTDFLKDSEYLANNEIRQYLVKGQDLAMQTLEAQRTLLLQMANYLCDNRIVHREKMMELIANYAIDFDIQELTKDRRHLYYRKHLKHLITKTTQSSNTHTLAEIPVSLNSH